MPPRVQLEGEQIEAQRRIMSFIHTPKPAKQWFSLKGLAGCGKTTVFAEIAHEMPGSVFCAYTGKAASVLGRKTGLPTTTVHGAIMSLTGKIIDAAGKEELIFERHVREGRWLNRNIFLDEDSMIPRELAMDLLATGARLITCGDPGQLPPVKGEAFFTGADFELTQIRRQAMDSAIIRQAHIVRAGGMYESDGLEFQVVRHMWPEAILGADIILCWRNATRTHLNDLKRRHIGLWGWPRVGEPVMCLRNNHDVGVLNGAVYTLEHIARDPDYGLDDGQRGQTIGVVNERGQYVEIEQCWFEGVDETTRPMDRSVGFTYAYAATVHKFQGSEADNIILVDEYSRREDRERWLYTAITRAKQNILVQRNW